MFNQRTDSVLVSLRRVRLNAGGYDALGNYWGVGPRLYIVVPEDQPQADTWHVRAYNRSKAKDLVRARWPKATFYR